MKTTDAIDVSRWQGDINWGAVPHPIAILKMSGADDGLYYDNKATQNYYQAKNAGKAVGMYHFAGASDARAEAEFFVNACSPLENGDVLILDWEVQHRDPVGWCETFVNRVHELTGIWPLIYMNGSTLNSQDWSRVTRNCGVWVAWYDRDPNADLPVHTPYVMHQYTSTGKVPGIAGNVDLNVWYGSVEQFKKYGYQYTEPVTPPEPPTVQPIPAPPLVVAPVPVIMPEVPVIQPTKQEETNVETIPVSSPPAPAPTPENNPIRPKVKAGAVAGVVTSILLAVLGSLAQSPELNVASIGSLAATLITFLTAYQKKDGLSPKQ